jgi:error-prone DNA polymerase
VSQIGCAAEKNGERHLKPPAEMARLFRDHPEALTASLGVLEVASGFSLDELRHEYPDEILDPGLTPQETLAARVAAAVAERWPEGAPHGIPARLHHELTLIAQLDYAPYSLTVDEVVRFARQRGILCQGRGSAANSAVCYVLGITAVDPAKHDLLFERFVSASRAEPPDIDAPTSKCPAPRDHPMDWTGLDPKALSRRHRHARVRSRGRRPPRRSAARRRYHRGSGCRPRRGSRRTPVRAS